MTQVRALPRRLRRHWSVILAVVGCSVLGLSGAVRATPGPDQQLAISSNQVAAGASFLATVSCTPGTTADVTLNGETQRTPCGASRQALFPLTAPGSPGRYFVEALGGQASQELTVPRPGETTMSVQSPVAPGQRFTVRIADCPEGLPVSIDFEGDPPPTVCVDGSATFNLTAPSFLDVLPFQVEVQDDPTDYLGNLTIVAAATEPGPDDPGPTDPGLPGTGATDAAVQLVAAAAVVALGVGCLALVRRRRHLPRTAP